MRAAASVAVRTLNFMSRKITIELPIGPEATKALQCFRLWYWGKNPRGVNLNTVAFDVLMTALAHPAELKQWIDGQIWYRELEDIDDRKHTVGLIAARPEYKRVLRAQHRKNKR